jgi:hypothetical protein
VIRIAVRVVGFAACILAGTLLLAQTEFSADVVNMDKAGKPETPSKMYFGKGKIRIEGTDPSGRGSGIVIVNIATQTATILMPQQHMYMEMPQDAESKQKFSMFRATDPANACEAWLKSDENKGGTCHKAGTETVDGRSTIKYEGTNAKGEARLAWFDPKFGFPVKWQGTNERAGELHNIKEGAQPASLFDIPAGFTKMDMGGMMQRK